MKNIFVVFTDGGARGNPGPGAVGVVVFDEKGNEVVRFGKKIGHTTNNVAEYMGVVSALEWFSINYKNKIDSIKFNLDSRLVVNQLNGIFKIKDKKLRELIIKVRLLEREVGGNIFYKDIPREKNTIADFLVNSSLDN